MPNFPDSSASRKTSLRTFFPFDRRWLLAIAALLVVIAVIGGVYIGLGAGQGSPVKQEGVSGAAANGAPDLAASAQMEALTGKSALGGASAVTPAEAGGIVAPGGVELQRPEVAAPVHAAPASVQEPEPGAGEALPADQPPGEPAAAPLTTHPDTPVLIQPGAAPASH